MGEMRFHSCRLTQIEETIGTSVNATSGTALGKRKKSTHPKCFHDLRGRRLALMP